MIPKRLIFIWLGSELPLHATCCIDAFKKVNPDFEVMVVNELDPYHSNNEDLNDCIRLVNSDEYNLYKHMTVRPYAKNHLQQTKIGRITALTDGFRMYLLNKYGGIYLDTDTFPVKPFDDRILSYEDGFAVNHMGKRCDYFFLGFPPGCVDRKLIAPMQAYEDKQLFASQVHRLRYSEKVIWIRKEKVKKNLELLKAGKLPLGSRIFEEEIFVEYYIDHYRTTTWRN